MCDTPSNVFRIRQVNSKKNRGKMFPFFFFILTIFLGVDVSESGKKPGKVVTKSPHKCRENEVPACDQRCQPTCSDPSIRPCYTPVCKDGCVCKENYIRKYEHGPCVSVKECSGTVNFYTLQLDFFFSIVFVAFRFSIDVLYSLKGSFQRVLSFY